MELWVHRRPQHAGTSEVVTTPSVVILAVEKQPICDSEHFEPQVEPIGQQAAFVESFGSTIQLFSELVSPFKEPTISRPQLAAHV